MLYLLSLWNKNASDDVTACNVCHCFCTYLYVKLQMVYNDIKTLKFCGITCNEKKENVSKLLYEIFLKKFLINGISLFMEYHYYILNSKWILPYLFKIKFTINLIYKLCHNKQTDES